MLDRIFKRFFLGAGFAAAAGLCGPAHAASWSGMLNGRPAFINDTSQPIRVAIVNNMWSFLSDADREMRTLAKHYNALLIDTYLDYNAPDASAQRVLDTLKAGSKAFPDHPEIQNLNVVLIGFSAGSAGAAIAASSPLLSNPDPTQAPQRVLAVATFEELDIAPYLPPPSVPHLFLSDPGDFYGGLLTNVEDLQPPMSHDAFARSLAAQGRPITVVSQPGDWHGGSIYGWNHWLTARFMRFWMEDVLSLSLPATPPTAAPALAPDWRTYAGAWRGTYDVVTRTNTQPWGNNEHMVNVAIAPQASYQDSRAFVWLPTQNIADKWQAYAVTGSLPPEKSFQPLTVLTSFMRPGPDATSNTYVDSGVTAVIGSGPAVPNYTSSCGFSPSGDGNLILNFDRAITSADAVATGGYVSGAVRAWSHVLIIPLKRSVYSPSLNIQVANITPADGSAPLTLDIAAKYSSPCP